MILLVQAQDVTSAAGTISFCGSHPHVTDYNPMMATLTYFAGHLIYFGSNHDHKHFNAHIAAPSRNVYVLSDQHHLPETLAPH
ncbi:hypothetical protein CGRA01v4_10304 [Colletotrichum graminicola]|nr:hypothetical protein CGRA01v4_10304 [Colletotrichum graminicola]